MRWGGSGKLIWKELSSWTMIGRRSDLRVVRVCHSESIDMWEETIVRLGEEGFPWEERRVWELSLRCTRSEFVMESVTRVPLAAVEVSVVREYQAALWALKSPMMM